VRAQDAKRGSQDKTQVDPALRAYYSGNGLLARGLDELAIQEYRTFLRSHADHAKAPVARYGLGVAHFRLGHMQDAADALTPLLKLPDFPSFKYAAETQLMLGQAALALGQFARAADILSDMAEAFPEHDNADQAMALLVEALHRAGANERAARTGRNFVKRFPNSGALDRAELFRGVSEMALTRFADAAKRFGGILDRSPDGPYLAQASLLRAQCLDRTGALGKAAALFQRVLDGGDDALTPDALVGLASIAHRAGKADDAAALLDRLLREFPASDPVGEAIVLRARIAVEQGALDDAKRLLKRAVARTLGPQDAALYWLGKAELRGGDHAEAAAHFTIALQQFPDSPLAPQLRYDLAVAQDRLGRSDDAAATLDAFLARNDDGPLKADALYLRAAIAHDAGEREKSDELLAALINNEPKSDMVPAASFLRIENAYLSGDLQEAVDRASRFLNAHPADAQASAARYRRGAALYQLGDLNDASAALARIVNGTETRTAFRPALLMLGDIAFRKDSYGDAERYFKQFLSFGPDQDGADDAMLKLGLAYARLDQPADALPMFALLLKTHPDSPHHLHALFESGQALVSLNRDDDAKAAFSALLEQGDDSRFAALALNHLGSIAERQGDDARAASLYAQAARTAKAGDSDIAPRIEATALYRRAQALFSDEDYTGAASAFAAFIATFSNDDRAPTARAQRGVALSRAGQTDVAIKALADVRQRDLQYLGEDLRSAVVYEHAWSLRASGDAAGATSALQALLSQEPAPTINLRAHALVELAELHMDEEHYGDAADLLRDARSLAATRDGRDAIEDELKQNAAYRLGVCEFRLKRFDEAARVMDEFLAGRDDDPLAESAALIAGESHHQQGRHAQAVERFKQALAHDDAPLEDQQTALLRMGESLAALQRWRESAASFQEYLERFSETPLWFQAQFGVGWALENQGQFDSEMAAYQKVIDGHQGETAARAQFQIGQCLFAKKAYEHAVRELLKVDILYAYPQWSAAALFEAGRCFEALEQPAAARKQFNQVVERFGDTSWAQLARARLAVPASRGIPGGE